MSAFEVTEAEQRVFSNLCRNRDAFIAALREMIDERTLPTPKPFFEDVKTDPDLRSPTTFADLAKMDKVDADEWLASAKSHARTLHEMPEEIIAQVMERALLSNARPLAAMLTVWLQEDAKGLAP